MLAASDKRFPFDPCLCYEIRRVGPEASAELRPGGRVLRQVSNQDLTCVLPFQRGDLDIGDALLLFRGRDLIDVQLKFLDHRRFQDRRNDLQLTAAVRAVLQVDLESEASAKTTESVYPTPIRS